MSADVCGGREWASNRATIDHLPIQESLAVDGESVATRPFGFKRALFTLDDCYTLSAASDMAAAGVALGFGIGEYRPLGIAGADISGIASADSLASL